MYLFTGTVTKYSLLLFENLWNEKLKITVESIKPKADG